MKIVIGVTGSIASGKSYVLSQIKNKGYSVIDCDQISRDITKKGNEGFKPVTDEFPYFDEKGELDRKKLGSIIFENKNERIKLNNILHPIIYEKCKKELEKLDGLIFLDAPLLYEANFDTLCDDVICVYVTNDVQQQRLMKRDNLTKEEAIKRIESQLSNKIKLSKSNFVVKSEEDFKETDKNIEKVLKQIKEKYHV